MSLADQIEALARSATAEVADASHRFSAAQRDLDLAMTEHRRTAAQSETDRLRAQLEHEADAADALPGIMLPADMADASPHLPPPNA
ncbi:MULTISPECIES: hypothetical protein [Gordonia]|uniref:Uncharacterized protein n=2 Tax=Gordonia alkanivorans TaxID=84096 RepID=F9VSL3_9ACTN|nr:MULTISPECIES: hypothetical protein [Gordonia]AZZ82956.1 hypothetical protein C5O27_19385 [Gordonia alkanivorans]ETA08720.1 hypothetical protein V525_01085 [Gordonia alkanivorans CGMCC 6845]MDH3005385.1 hypothetical protein [Gordonia alkanivorans]MDH3010318.1 hypothetical protein [Gordonia alkanivorans]MDH3014797.1 hypothetical protein [Gordonia alkanivorans]